MKRLYCKYEIDNIKKEKKRKNLRRKKRHYFKEQIDNFASKDNNDVYC